MKYNEIKECTNIIKSNIRMFNMKCLECVSKLIYNSYYKPEISFSDKNKSVEFIYKKENGKLTVTIYEEEYIVESKGDVFIIKPENLYEVINLIKLFYLDKPLDKLVLFTGAFNPPTIAHFNMIHSALEAGFDGVVFAISNNTFLTKKMSKSQGIDKDMVYSEQERLEMVLAMTRNIPNAFILGVEQGYTYDVLKLAKEKYSPNEMFFAMGSDKLNEIQRWGYADKLLSEFGFYVVKRGNDDNIKEKCDNIFENTHYIIGEGNVRYKNISSTLVREKILKEELFAEYVHDNVFLYITSHFQNFF